MVKVLVVGKCGQCIWYIVGKCGVGFGCGQEDIKVAPPPPWL